MITTEVETLDLISQLGKETVVEYEAEDATVSTIVNALLALQVQTPAITVGTIDGAYSALTRSIRVDGDTILRALYRLRDTVGGYIYVDNNRALQWTSSLGEDKGQQIRYRKNLKGIEREIDYTKLFNRIYAYGAGEGTARIKLSDAEGQTEDYVEDEGSQTEWGGIYPGVFTERSITHPDTLLAWANLLLSDYKNPPICYRIDAVDLSQSEELGFSFEALQLGSTITVIDEDLGIDVSVIVVKIEHPDLLHPEQITLELANRTKDITDTLAEVYDKQQLDHHVATTIGAGQVIVKGVFTVIDWVTEGETTIDGGNITAGTIIADAIGAGTITGKTIIISGADGILKSSNYAAGSAGWQIKGDGNAEFNAVVVRGNIQAGAGSVINFAYVADGPPADADKTSTSNQPYTWISGSKPPIDAEANPDYISSTYISSTEIKSPEISGTTGYFSGTFKVGSAGVVIDGSGKLIKSSNYSAGSAGWQIKNTGDAEFNNVKIRGSIYTSSIIGGNTLTVSGVISAGGGNVILDTGGITIKGQYLDFYYSTTRKGYVWADSAGFRVSAVSDHPLTLDAPGVGNKIIFSSDSFIMPQKTSAPSPSDGMLTYDPSDGYVKYYSVHDSQWFRIQRTGGWG